MQMPKTLAPNWIHKQQVLIRPETGHWGASQTARERGEHEVGGTRGAPLVACRVREAGAGWSRAGGIREGYSAPQATSPL